MTSSLILLYSSMHTGTPVRPRRPCIYCGQFKVDLRAHLLVVHKTEDKVEELENLGKKDKIAALGKLRKLGIAQKNKAILAQDDTDKLICERISGEKVMCSRCSGVFRTCYFYKHVKICQSPHKHMLPRPLGVQTFVQSAPSTSTTECDKVLLKMDKDKYYTIIKSCKEASEAQRCQN